MDPTYPAVPIVNLVAAFLTLLTLLTSARRSRNTGILLLCIWLFIGTLIQGIETIVWSRDAVNRTPVWCDICELVHPRPLGGF